MLNIIPFNMGHGNFIVFAELLLPNLFVNYEHFMACCAFHVVYTYTVNLEYSNYNWKTRIHVSQKHFITDLYCDVRNGMVVLYNTVSK
jgi:hypothetical protein